MTQQHTFDVVIVGAGGRTAGRPGELPAGADGGDHQAVPDPLPHRRRPGRHVRRPGQRRRGQLGVAHLRHHQGRRLPGRPGRGRGHVPGGDRGRLRPRAHGHAVQPHPRRQDRPAALRRPHPPPRQGGRAPLLLRRRPHRPHDPPDPVPAERQAGDHLLRRVLRARPAARRRPGGRGDRLRAGHRRAARVPGQGGGVLHRRLREDVQDHLQRPRPHRRRARGLLPARRAHGGHGVLPVPPDRPVPAGVLLSEAAGARAASCATPTARRSWSATPPPSRTWRPATWSAGPSTPRSARAAAPGPTATTSTWTSATSTPR